MKIALFGATSKTGRYLAAELSNRGHAVKAIGRDLNRLNPLSSFAHPVVADLTRPHTLPAVLADADVIVSLAHAAFVPTLIGALPQDDRRIILTGSLRKHTRLQDAAAQAVRDAEEAFIASRRRGVMLHPSMIYGAPEDRNVNRVLAYLGRFPQNFPVPVPLPDNGRHTVQPVFVDDVVAAFVAAIEHPEADGPPISVAGPEPMTYRDFVKACAAAIDRRTVIVPIPLSVLSAVAGAARALGVSVPVNAQEFARTAENKAFDILPLQERLGVTPRSFAEGLRLKVDRGWVPEVLRRHKPSALHT